MKRFLRYLLLVGCLGTIGVWGWSYQNSLLITDQNSNDSVCIVMASGRFQFFHVSHPLSMPPEFGWKFSFVTSSVNALSLKSFSNNNLIKIDIPIGLLFTPLLLLTLTLYYHPIKKWWRRTDLLGFEVEMKKNQRQAAKSAKEEIEKE